MGLYINIHIYFEQCKFRALTRIFWRFQQTSLMLMLRSNVTQQRLKNLLHNNVQIDKRVIGIWKYNLIRCFCFFVYKPTCAQDEGRTSKHAGSQGTAGRAEKETQRGIKIPATVFSSHWQCCPCATYSNDLSFGNGGGDAPHEQRAGPVEGPRAGRVIFGLLLLFLLLLGILLRLLLFFMWREESAETWVMTARKRHHQSTGNIWVVSHLHPPPPHHLSLPSLPSFRVYQSSWNLNLNQTLSRSLRRWLHRRCPRCASSSFSADFRQI